MNKDITKIKCAKFKLRLKAHIIS